MQWRPSKRAQVLAPFDHQVAGQSSMLVYDATTLCKPLIPREHFVYQTLPVELQEFTPQYRGEILVKLLETEGRIHLVGHAIGAADVQYQACQCANNCEVKPVSQDCGTSSGVSSGSRSSEDMSGSQTQTSSEACAAASDIFVAQDGGQLPTIFTMSSAASHLHPHTHSLNPWSLKNHKRLLEKMRKSSHRNDKTRFMLLGNVVADFKKPCILDLKIGSRLHGDDATSTKVASQTSKCKQTTSSSLAVRLCGMQVYQVKSGSFRSLDKYHGRKLTAGSLQETLRGFLHNGLEFRQELLQPIISKLAALIACVGKLDTYRFYASSLLIIYDGEVGEPGSRISQPVSADQEDDHLHCNLKKSKAKNSRLFKLHSDSVELNRQIPSTSEQTHVVQPECQASSAASAAGHDDSIYFSVSRSSDHCHDTTSQANIVPCSLSSHELLCSVNTVQRNKCLSSSLSCPNVSETSSPQTKCVSKVGGDHLSIMSFPLSHECHSGTSSTKCDSFSLDQDSKDCLETGCDEKTAPSVLHSCQLANTHHRPVENGETSYFCDLKVKTVSPASVSDPGHSEHEDRDKTSFEQNTAKVSENLSGVNLEENYPVSSSCAADSESLLSTANIHSLCSSALPVHNIGDVREKHLHQLREHIKSDTFSVGQQPLGSVEVQIMQDPVKRPGDETVGHVHQNLPLSATSLTQDSGILHTLSQKTISLEEQPSSGENLAKSKTLVTKVVKNREEIVPGSPSITSTMNHSVEEEDKGRDDKTKVDVKMIDFAHTTHSGFVSDKIQHSGPDKDYILGLENLKALFQQLQDVQNLDSG